MLTQCQVELPVEPEDVGAALHGLLVVHGHEEGPQVAGVGEGDEHGEPHPRGHKQGGRRARAEDARQLAGGEGRGREGRGGGINGD